MPTVPEGMASGAPEPSVARRVFLAGRPQIAPVIVGPQLVLEDEFSVGRLPQHEVAGPLLTRSAQKQVDVGNVGSLHVSGDGGFGDAVGIELAGSDLVG